MPVKNKKTKSTIKKKQNSKSSRPTIKKAAPAKKIVKSKTSSKKKQPSKAKASPKKKLSIKKIAVKKKTISASKPVKKAKPVPNIKTKTSPIKKSTTTKPRVVINKASEPVKKMTKKVIQPVKPTTPIKKIETSPKTTDPVVTKSSTSIDQQKKPTIEKSRIAEITKLVKAAAKKTHLNQPLQRVRRPGAGPSGFLPYNTKSDEDYMNDAQLAHFQRVLHLWKEQLYAGRDATAQHMRDDTVNFPDPLDRAALEEEHTLEWRAREREHRLITKIDQALIRIKQGDYGYCDACGAEIGIRRLEARPTATQCIDCKTIDEIREKHTGTVE